MVCHAEPASRSMEGCLGSVRWCGGQQSARVVAKYGLGRRHPIGLHSSAAGFNQSPIRHCATTILEAGLPVVQKGEFKARADSTERGPGQTLTRSTPRRIRESSQAQSQVADTEGAEVATACPARQSLGRTQKSFAQSEGGHGHRGCSYG